MFLSKSFYFALFTLSVPVISNAQNNPVQSGCTAPTTQVIAHRGYWDTHGSAQNSLASLEKADEIGAYGSECDVYLCPDGELMVFHDPHVNINGTMREIERTPSTVLRQAVLANGETMPTFAAYLDKFKQCKQTKLIIELKAQKIDKRGSETLAAKIVEMVKRTGVEERVEYITFNRDAMLKLIELDPEAKVAYLTGDLSPAEAKAVGCTGIDYSLDKMKQNEHWFREAREAGLEINVWTVNKTDDMRYLIGQGVDYITTDAPELLQKILQDYTLQPKH